MKRSAKPNRRETVALAILVSGAVLYGGGKALLKHQRQEHSRREIEESRVYVELGAPIDISDSLSIAQRDDEEHGELWATVLESTWYSSFEEADATEDLGWVNEYDMKDGPFVVVDVCLEGNDFKARYGDKEGLFFLGIFVLLHPDKTTYTPHVSIWSDAKNAGDEKSPGSVYFFGPNDAISVRIGFSLPKGTETGDFYLTPNPKQLLFLLEQNGDRGRE